jgi:tetratricopeptide (TPR) repeat protein
VFYKQGSYEQAVEMYNEALNRSVSSSSAYINLGNAHFKLGREDKAEEAWRKALEIDPANEKASQYLERVESKKR